MFTVVIYTLLLSDKKFLEKQLNIVFVPQIFDYTDVNIN
jgi:hypothetical protein